ncbi:MAG: histidinol-phosphatase HisJ family protein, partial [Verrucomicrobiia bacterium]
LTPCPPNPHPSTSFFFLNPDHPTLDFRSHPRNHPRMRSDLHTHTPLCQHAEGSPAEMVAAARAAGLDEIGFSDHNPMPTQFDQWRMAPDELPRYLAWIDEARLAHPGFPIRIGLECDFIPGNEPHLRTLTATHPWDYLIGSVHYIMDDWDVDSPFKRQRWNDQPVDQVWTAYFSRLEQAIDSQLFDFIGHFDLVKKFGDIPSGNLDRFYTGALDRLEAYGTALELNTAGWRKPVNEPYPSPAILREACRRGIPVLVNSDAHSPSEVAADFDRAYRILHEAGYRSVVRFHQREPIPVPLS